MAHCPNCLAPGRVLETRREKAGDITYRRYTCNTPSCPRFTTWELNRSIILALGKTKTLEYVAQAQRGAENRAMASLRKKRVKQLVAQKVPTTEIAAALQVSTQRIRQLRKELGL